jgi:sulfide:quinone oxidoreductase
MTGRRAFDMDVAVQISIVTPEDVPLALSGSAASSAVSDLLARARIETITSAYVEIPRDGRVVEHPHDRQLQFDRVVALPELYGPSLRGTPLAEHGFVQVDQAQRVPHSGPVYAAGDVAQFAIKLGGVASQQADAAAESIAALAGAPVTPKPLHPVVRAALDRRGVALSFRRRDRGARLHLRRECRADVFPRSRERREISRSDARTL